MTDHITCNILQINIYDSNYWKICCIMKSKRHFPLQKKKKKRKEQKCANTNAHTLPIYEYDIKPNSVRIKFLS